MIALSRILRLTLALCLAWYSPAVMAGAGGAGGTMSMEICANGAIQTVELETGAPSGETPDACCICACCHVDAAAPVLPDAAPHAHAYHVFFSLNPDGSSLTRTPNIRPLPRAPPPARSAWPVHRGVIASDHARPGPDDMRSTGRPLSKDAVA